MKKQSKIKSSPSYTKSRYLSIRSRHPSCRVLRKAIRIAKFAVYRHGSVNETSHKYEINSVDSIKIASSKLLMKNAFDKGGVKHLPWGKLSEVKKSVKGLQVGKFILTYPVVIKNTYGSRGRGNYKIDTAEQFDQFLSRHEIKDYIIEQFFSGSREYRVHITKQGPVYCLRKLLKNETPQAKRWIRNDETCVWITQFQISTDEHQNFLGFREAPNPMFDCPVNWASIIDHCKKALESTGLDIGAVDLKVQSSKDKEGHVRGNPDFYIIEINSAPSLGRITGEVYKKELPKIIESKYK